MIAENIQKLQTSITVAAQRAGRNPSDIKLVAVSKRFPASAILEAYSAGQLFFGENYIQEVQNKKERIPSKAVIHFIGHLQTNKAKIAAETCNMVETVDRIKLGKTLNKHLARINKTLDILIQVNIGNDPAKSGINEDETEDLLIQLNELNNIRVCGLMTIPPFVNDPELSRPNFSKLNTLCLKMKAKGLFPNIDNPELSMGMSSDFHIAIEEGATIVRIGTAIFGNRPATLT